MREMERRIECAGSAARARCQPSHDLDWPAARRKRSGASPRAPARTAPPAPVRTPASPGPASRPGRPDEPPGAYQQCDMDCQSHGAVGIASAGQRAQFSRAEYAIGYRVLDTYVDQNMPSSTRQAARRSSRRAWNTATACNVRPAWRIEHRAAARRCRIREPTRYAHARGARARGSACRLPMKRVGGHAMPNWRQSRFRHNRRHVGAERVGDLAGIAPVGHADDRLGPRHARSRSEVQSIASMSRVLR